MKAFTNLKFALNVNVSIDLRACSLYMRRSSSTLKLIDRFKIENSLSASSFRKCANDKQYIAVILCILITLLTTFEAAVHLVH